MDRIDAMKVFVAALDEGSLTRAARKLSRSPAAASRAISFLEGYVGAQLLHRTTRSIRLSDVGQQYAATCRRVLSDLEAADLLAAAERSAPRGVLAIRAPLAGGEELLRPILDAFIDATPAVTCKLCLTDRPGNLIEDGVDVDLRFGPLQDSALKAVKVGEVRRVIAASPRYLATHPTIDSPADLARHQIIALTDFGLDAWSFPPGPDMAPPRLVQFTPRLVVNSARAAVASAVDGHGVTCVYSHHISSEVRTGVLEVLLERHEPRPAPVHLLTPAGRLSVPKVRSFVDFAAPRLRSHLAVLALAPATAARRPSPAARLSAV